MSRAEWPADKLAGKNMGKYWHIIFDLSMSN